MPKVHVPCQKRCVWCLSVKRRHDVSALSSNHHRIIESAPPSIGDNREDGGSKCPPEEPDSAVWSLQRQARGSLKSEKNKVWCHRPIRKSRLATLDRIPDVPAKWDEGWGGGWDEGKGRRGCRSVVPHPWCPSAATSRPLVRAPGTRAGPGSEENPPGAIEANPMGLVNPKSRRGHPSFPRLSKSPRFSPPIASVCVAVLIFDVAPERLATQLPALFVALGRGRVRKCRCIVVWASFRSGCRGVSIPHRDLTGGKTPVWKPRRRRPESTRSARPRTHSQCLHTHGTASMPTPRPIQVHPSGVMGTGRD